MKAETFAKLRDWVEPAHPMIVERYDDLLTIYRFIREKHQETIDKLFDEVARQIGYIVTSTVPVMLEFAEEGKLKDVEIGAEHLRGTLFEKVVSVLQPGERLPVRAGKFNLYLIWFNALKLRLRKDWVEPAHFRQQFVFERLREQVAAAEVQWDVREPAHWFDPGTRLVPDDIMIISVLDEVYPELRLADRVAFYRYADKFKIPPDVMEPAHFRRGDLEQLYQRLRVLLEK